jgi:hypothetical protein
MALAADVLIVAGQRDRVADRLRRDLEKIGRQVAWLDGPSAARLFTIRVRTDAVTVVPSPAMFVRGSAWWHDRGSSDADGQFLRAEAYATFWAASVLSKAAVINRIPAGGGIGRMTAGALAALLPTGNPASDIYASGPEFIVRNGDDSLWGEDLEFRVGAIAELRRGEPLRARRVNPTAPYEIVIVVGDRAFPATTDPRTAELGLPERSVVLCRRLGLHFAAVTWAVDEQGATAIRLNPAPEETEVRYSWREVSQALSEDLTR